MTNDDEFKDLAYNQDTNSYEENSERRPPSQDYDVFRLRTDPAQLLDDIKLELLRKKKKYHKGGSISDEFGRYDLEAISKDVKPMANDLGVEEILMTIKKAINNHTVQGFTSTQKHLENMRAISDFLTRTFWAKRKQWGLKLNDVNNILNGIINTIDYFLSRTIDNQERKLYGEQFKESTSREFKANPPKNNPFSRLFNNMARR